MGKQALGYDKEEFLNRIQILIDEHCGGNQIQFNDIVGQKNAVYRWRTEGHFPRVEALVRIKNHFRVSMDWLLGLADEKQEADQEGVQMPKERESNDYQELINKILETKKLLNYYREVADHYRDLYEHARQLIKPISMVPQDGAAEKIQP